MRRRDPSKGEGAIYRPVQQPLTPAEAEAQSKAGPRDEVAEARRLALDVMTHCYGRGVGIDQAGEPTRNGEPLPFPEVGAYPEILWDAWAVLDYARSVETLSRAATDAAFAPHAAEIARGLAGAAVALGRTTERLAIRWEGLENRARLGKLKEDFTESQRKGPPTEKAIELLANGAGPRELERQCGISFRIARRWWKEFSESG